MKNRLVLFIILFGVIALVNIIIISFNPSVLEQLAGQWKIVSAIVGGVATVLGITWSAVWTKLPASAKWTVLVLSLALCAFWTFCEAMAAMPWHDVRVRLTCSDPMMLQLREYRVNVGGTELLANESSTTGDSDQMVFLTQHAGYHWHEPLTAVVRSGTYADTAQVNWPFLSFFAPFKVIDHEIRIPAGNVTMAIRVSPPHASTHLVQRSGTRTALDTTITGSAMIMLRQAGTIEAKTTARGYEEKSCVKGLASVSSIDTIDMVLKPFGASVSVTVYNLGNHELPDATIFIDNAQSGYHSGALIPFEPGHRHTIWAQFDRPPDISLISKPLSFTPKPEDHLSFRLVVHPK
ncbi:MAG: hypothetical protein WAU88_03800 [Candidatus Zixiibacteriota bacterium]